MCNSPTCPGDCNAPSKQQCRACYGVNYKDPGQRREEFFAMKQSEVIEHVAKRLYRAVADLEYLKGCRTNRGKLYASLVMEEDPEAADMLCMLLEGRRYLPETEDY